MWSVTADPEEFAEASEWFRDRFPVTPDLAAKLGRYAGGRAWTISGVAQLDVVLHAYDHLLKAIENGTPFEDWQDQVEESLTKSWGEPDSARLATIFRNATQQSLNAGRYRQMTDPEVKDLRPYVLLDGINDAAQSDICEKIDGTIVHIDDPWLASHHPQLHHRCRTQEVSLSAEDAERRGVTKDLPAAKADKGFGAPPDDNSKPWRPEPTDYPPELFKVYEDKNTPTEGVHFKSFKSNASKKTQAAALEAFAETGLLPYLERYPLNELTLNRTAGRNASGHYAPGHKELAAAAVRKAATFGQQLEPGKTWAISTAAETAIEATKRTLVHETAHHIHFQNSKAGDGFRLPDRDPVDRVISKAFANPDKKPISKYANHNYREYFAESFTAYKYHRAELREHDPVGFTMVEEVLTLRGITL